MLWVEGERYKRSVRFIGEKSGRLECGSIGICPLVVKDFNKNQNINRPFDIELKVLGWAGNLEVSYFS